MLRPVEISQLVDSKVDKGAAAMIDERPGHLRDDHLTSVGGSADAAGAMYVQADIVIATEGSLSRVKSDPDPHRNLLWPLVLLQALLDSDRRLNGIVRRLEHEEERVAHRPDFHHVCWGHRRPHERVVIVDYLSKRRPKPHSEAG